jgi:hypothetical protein
MQNNLAISPEDHDMDNRKEETAIRQSSKKTTGKSSFSIPSAGYSSPTRISRSSNKPTQASSPAAHYAMSSQRPSTPSKKTKTLQFFAPGGNAEKTLAAAVALSQRLASHKTTPSKVIKIIDDRVDDNDVDGHPGNFLGGKADNRPKLGDDATGKSPMAPGQPSVDINSPPKQSPVLCPSSFVPALSNPLPNMDGTVDVDPDFFEGTNQDGSGPGSHFITIS